MITIKNGSVYMGGSFFNKDIYIEDEYIKEIGENLPERGKIIDAKGKIVSHGFIDMHVHLREPGFAHKETIKTGTIAAAAGGFTTICSMPNLNPVPDSPAHVQAQLDIIEKDAVVNVIPFASITVGQKGKEIVDMIDLAPFVAGFSDDGKGVQSDEIMEEVMQKAGETGVLISAHCEDESLLNGGYIHDGVYARLNGHKGISSECEYKQVVRDIGLAEKYGARYHVCHISAKESIEAVKEGKAKNIQVSCEVTPHHIALCDSDIKSDDGRFKMNPPLRDESDKDAILNGILDGTIDCIATDHAPHSLSDKAKGLKDSAMGIVGIETAFAICHTHLVVNNGIPLSTLLDLLTAGGKIINTENDIAVGAVADLTIIDINENYTIESNSFKSMGKSTPFEGFAVKGRVTDTIVSGKEVYTYAG